MFHEINHPAIGIPPFVETPKYLYKSLFIIMKTIMKNLRRFPHLWKSPLISHHFPMKYHCHIPLNSLLMMVKSPVYDYLWTSPFLWKHNVHSFRPTPRLPTQIHHGGIGHWWPDRQVQGILQRLAARRLSREATHFKTIFLRDEATVISETNKPSFLSTPPKKTIICLIFPLIQTKNWKQPWFTQVVGWFLRQMPPVSVPRCWFFGAMSWEDLRCVTMCHSVLQE